MPQENHANILRSGVDAWNQWRKENSGVVPSLDSVILRGENLAKADLSLANLNEADLREADLSESSLVGASVADADLRRANLAKANLHGTNLNRARLTGASLAWTNLRLCSLKGADLREANLENAELGGTVLADTDLSNAHGLHLCNHWGPVIIDHRTLVKSGHLPVAFLRGCGLPEAFIEQLPVLFEDPMQLCAVFIAFSTQDKAFSRLLHDDLQASGVRCWFVPEAVKTEAQLSEALPLHETILIPVLSKHWLAGLWLSKLLPAYFQEERLRNKTIVVPIRLDDAVMTNKMMEGIARTRQFVDFRKWKDPKSYKAALKTLIGQLRTVAANNARRDSSG